MRSPWDLPSAEWYACVTNAGLEFHLMDMLYQLYERRGKRHAIAWLDKAKLEIYEWGNSEPKLPIPHRQST